MAGPLVAATAIDALGKNPKAAKAVSYGTIGIVLLSMGISVFVGYKLLQKLGLIDDQSDRIAQKWQSFIQGWVGLNPNYWSSAPEYQTLTQSDVIRYRNQLKTSWGFWDDDESRAYAALEAIGSAANLSRVAQAYDIAYSKSLKEDILYHMDDNDEAVRLARIFINYPDFRQSLRKSNVRI